MKTEPTDYDADAIARLSDLFEGDWSVDIYGDYILVYDGATRWWGRASQITADVMDAAEKHPPTGGSERYDTIVRLVDGLHDDSVPADIVNEARDDLCLDDGDSVAYGW